MTTKNDVLATRKRLGWSQQQLADALSNGAKTRVSYQTIARWERGDRTPPPYLKLALELIELREAERRANE